MILIVEDDAATARMLAQVIKYETGYGVLTTGDAPSALAIIRRTPIDLVLSDIHLPGMDGLEFYDRLRADPVTVQLPILLMSAAKGHPGIMQRKLAALLVSKPFALESLLERIEYILRPGA